MAANHHASPLGKARTFQRIGTRLFLFALIGGIVLIVATYINRNIHKPYSDKSVKEWVDISANEGWIISDTISHYVLSNTFRVSNSNVSFQAGSHNIQQSASHLKESGLESIGELVLILERKEDHLIDIYYNIARRLPNSIRRILPQLLSQ